VDEQKATKQYVIRVIARSGATKQSRILASRPGLLRYARNDDLNSSCLGPAEAVPHRRHRAGKKYAHIAKLLIFAVERDARQRGEMLGVRAEDDAGPRRHGGLEAELGGNGEFALPRRAGIAVRIGQMRRPRAERRPEHPAA